VGSQQRVWGEFLDLAENEAGRWISQRWTDVAMQREDAHIVLFRRYPENRDAPR
jgi:hypothetical protein